jgi:hypothetical protein
MIYSLAHWHEQFDGAVWPMGDEKHIGFFETMDDVDAAIAQLRLLEGFRDYPDGFRVREVALDVDQWPTGFSLRADHDLIPSSWWSRLRRDFRRRTRRVTN